jgi:hypothetical protein
MLSYLRFQYLFKFRPPMQYIPFILFLLKFPSCAFFIFTVCVVSPHPLPFDRSVCIRVHLSISFLGALAKLWKMNISFIMSVSFSAFLPVRKVQLGSHWKDFHEIWFYNIFLNFLEKIPVSIKSDMKNVYFVGRPMYVYANILPDYSWNEKYLRQNF